MPVGFLVYLRLCVLLVSLFVLLPACPFLRLSICSFLCPSTYLLVWLFTCHPTSLPASLPACLFVRSPRPAFPARVPTAAYPAGVPLAAHQLHTRSINSIAYHSPRLFTGTPSPLDSIYTFFLLSIYSSCITSEHLSTQLGTTGSSSCTSIFMYPTTYPITHPLHSPFINLPFTRVRLHQRLNYRSIFLFTQLVINPSLGITCGICLAGLFASHLPQSSLQSVSRRVS